MIRARINPAPKIRSLAGRQVGFTLIELMIVILIISILMAIAAPLYTQSVIRAKESVLKQDLFTLREQIDNYTLDKEKAPQSLEDLVSAGYIKEIPEDPFTDSTKTWITVREEVAGNKNVTETGITDVHNGSNAIAMDGTPYSSW